MADQTRQNGFATYWPRLVLAALGAGMAIAIGLTTTVNWLHGAWAVVVLVFASPILAKHARSFWRSLRAIVITLSLIAIPALVDGFTGNLTGRCPQICWRFEDGAQGWGLRVEREVLLGVSALQSDRHDRGGWLEHHSLAVSFSLGGEPLDKTQVKVEGAKLEQQLAAYVYVPAELPASLLLSGFVLEHNQPGSGRAEWLFFQTRPVPLTAGTWNHVVFGVDQFGSADQRLSWRNPPLMVGFEIRDRNGGNINGTVYFDQITVR